MVTKTLWIGFMMIASIFTTPLVANSTTATEMQKEADVLREDGKSLQAIDLYNQSIVQYQEANDYSGILGALTGRLLSWKHLFYKTEAQIYALIVKKETELMLEVATEHQLLDRLYLIHYLNGTAAILLNDYPTAEKEFGKAVEIYPTEHAEKGDWMAHLGDAMYRNGKKEDGKRMLLHGVQIIKERSSQIDSFLFNVWVSGAYLRLAKLLKNDNPTESQMYLNQAKEIIDSDDRLVIRKQQLNDYIQKKS